MKKVLFATTALVMTAGAAAAEVATSGTARMGLYYDGNDFFYTSRVRVIFDMSGETDGGLTFGASIRADNSGIGNGGDGTGFAHVPGDDMSAGSVYIAGAFGKLSMGDNDTAANALVGHVSGVGLTGLGDRNELGYVGQRDTSILYTYSMDALSFALSAGQIGSDDYSVAVKYAPGTFAVALGYEDGGTVDQITLGGSATFGAATVKAVLADNSTNPDMMYAVSVDGEFSGIGVTAFYSDRGGPAGTLNGIGGSYDLGGGAKVVGGIVDSDFNADIVADFGVSMSF